jgi:hypothetical protein
MFAKASCTQRQVGTWASPESVLAVFRTLSQSIPHGSEKVLSVEIYIMLRDYVR